MGNTERCKMLGLGQLCFLKNESTANCNFELYESTSSQIQFITICSQPISNRFCTCLESGAFAGELLVVEHGLEDLLVAARHDADRPQQLQGSHLLMNL